MYSFNLLFVALVADSLVRWRSTLRDRDLLVACAWYVVSFGNHLTMVTMLPAFVFFVLATRWRVLVEWKLVWAVSGMILLGLLPYAYPVVRSLDPGTPYLANSVTNLAELGRYATGADFDGAMFAFTTPRQLFERLPIFAPYFWRECGLLIPLAIVGLATLFDRITVGFLGLTSLGHLVFALGFDGGDVDNYYIPIYFAIAILAGVGLEWLLRSSAGRRIPAALCLALPLALGVHHWPEVDRLKGADKAEPMRDLLEATRGGALIIARYNDYMYLLYYNLAEGRGGSSVFLGYDVAVADVVAYVRDDQPLYLAPLRKWTPPGLPVYSTRLNFRPELRAAGLLVKLVTPSVFQIERPPVTTPDSPR